MGLCCTASIANHYSSQLMIHTKCMLLHRSAKVSLGSGQLLYRYHIISYWLSMEHSYNLTNINTSKGILAFNITAFPRVVGLRGSICWGVVIFSHSIYLLMKQSVAQWSCAVWKVNMANYNVTNRLPYDVTSNITCPS